MRSIMRLKEARARTKFGQSFLYLQISGQTDSPGGAKDFYSEENGIQAVENSVYGFMCGSFLDNFSAWFFIVGPRSTLKILG